MTRRPALVLAAFALAALAPAAAQQESAVRLGVMRTASGSYISVTVLADQRGKAGALFASDRAGIMRSTHLVDRAQVAQLIGLLQELDRQLAEAPPQAEAQAPR